MTNVETILEFRPAAPDGGFRRTAEPVCVGIPFPKGLVASETAIQIVDPEGRSVPVQATVTDRWSDKSIRWVLLNLLVNTADDGSARYGVRVSGARSDAAESHLRASSNAGGADISTGRLEARLRLNDPHPMQVEWGGTRATVAVVIQDATGQRLAPEFHDATVDRVGAVAARVQLTGMVRLPTRATLAIVLRAEAFAGLGVLGLSLAVHNPRRAKHPGGIWELGDDGSALVRDVAVHLACEPSGPASGGESFVRYSIGPSAPWLVTPGPLSIVQASSGGEHWDSRVHVNRDGALEPAMRGYEVVDHGISSRGERSTPIVQCGVRGGRLAATMRHFWEDFPKAIEATAGSVVVRLFPGSAGTLHEIQGGERKRHDLTVLFGEDPVSDEPLAWARAPLVGMAPPDWYSRCDALPFLVPAGSDAADPLIETALEGPSSIVAKRERADEYGWRHFGDLYADHEAVNANGPFVSHYNNQYDPIAGFARQLFRSGDVRWHELLTALARHVADIDIYHTHEDKAAYNGGLFWHTYHYVDAGKSTHRSYPAAPGVTGGGPSAEHDYALGLALHYYLTGDPDSRSAVLELANWVCAMDDGCKNIFRWLDRGDTGWASATGSLDYQGPGRGAGNSIATLLTAARITSDDSYVSKAEVLIRRCIHPADDPNRHDLLDPERRWSYTVFLQALGSYLGFKAERNELDGAYAYARASLLTYARWMRGAEYPYLDKPELLEYPTETWVAQELRKAEVFVTASLYTDGAEREQMKERAEFFFEYAISTLRTLPTASFTRPLALLLSYSAAVPWLRLHPDARAGAAAPPASEYAASPATFVPQRFRAIRRAKIGMVAGATAALTSGLVWLLW